MRHRNWCGPFHHGRNIDVCASKNGITSSEIRCMFLICFNMLFRLVCASFFVLGCAVFSSAFPQINVKKSTAHSTMHVDSFIYSCASIAIAQLFQPRFVSFFELNVRNWMGKSIKDRKSVCHFNWKMHRKRERKNRIIIMKCNNRQQQQNSLKMCN